MRNKPKKQVGLHMTIRGRIIAALAVVFSLMSGGAHANSPDTNLILEKLAALEARVAALESENREYKRELNQARAQARMEPARSLRFANAAGTSEEPPRLEVEQPRVHPGWTGAFWGASAGGAATRAATSSAERAANALFGGPPPFDLTGYTASDVSGTSKGGGGFIDLFAGADVQFSRIVIGGQLEATASDLNFSSSGTRTYTYFNSFGPTGITATGDYRPQVAARWMASALLRTGALLDDNTLLYGLGGWTFARFEARNVTDNAFYQPNETFWASGPTGGVGIERKLDSNWRVRAEYRYTKFDTARTQDQFAWAYSSGNQTYSRATQFDQSMQSGRIGFAYSFNPLK